MNRALQQSSISLDDRKNILILKRNLGNSIWGRSQATKARSRLIEVGRNVAFVSQSSLKCKFILYYDFDSRSHEQYIS